MTDPTSCAQLLEPGHSSAILEGGKLLVSPLLAAILGGYLVTRWKTREDGIERRVDELVAAVSEAASLSSTYWSQEPTQPNLKLSAALVLSAMARVDGTRSILSKTMSRSAAEEISKAAEQFLRWATGGDFGVHNRPGDVDKAAFVLQSGAIFCVAIRKARHDDLRGFFLRRR